MLKSSSELPDESLDSDELSDDASESDSSLELLSSSLETSPSKMVRQQGTGISALGGKWDPRTPRSGWYQCLDNPIWGVPFGSPKWDPGEGKVFGCYWVLNF